MSDFTSETIQTFEDIKLFESSKPLNQRLPESSILDVFENRAKENPNSIAITMLMSGEKNEQPRRITYNELNQSIKQAANLFSSTCGYFTWCCIHATLTYRNTYYFVGSRDSWICCAY